MIKLKKFADDISSAQQKTDRSFASASSNVVLRNTAIENSPDHDDPFYGENDPDGDTSTKVVNKITKPAKESDDHESDMNRQMEDASKITGMKTESSIDDSVLYMEPREDSAVMEESTDKIESNKSDSSSDDEDYLVGI